MLCTSQHENSRNISHHIKHCSTFIEVGKARWHVQRMGAGPPLLLLHGFTDNYVKVSFPADDSWVNHLVEMELTGFDADGLVTARVADSVLA